MQPFHYIDNDTQNVIRYIIDYVVYDRFLNKRINPPCISQYLFLYFKPCE